MATTIFFSVGEPSGDLHGANLIRELRQARPDIQCVGYGGPQMEAAGCDLHTDLTKFAVMWIAHVIIHLHRFLRLLFQAKRFFREQQPDAVVLIDYPGFNWWIARCAKAHQIPVYYYGTPQLWAWAPWRVAKMRRFVDHVLCKLPFEPDWFEARGCQATYVGHPYFDELATRELDEEFVKQLQSNDLPLVTVLPGSRSQEVDAHLPVFLKTIAHIQTAKSASANCRFAIACFTAAHAIKAREMLSEADLPAAQHVAVHVHRTAELIEAANVCLACSGSVSLELLYHAKPSIILYQVSRLGYRLQDRFRIARYITLVNLLATDQIERSAKQPYDPDDPSCESVPMPEYLTCDDRSADIARRLTNWLESPAARAANQARLVELRERYGIPGASKRAANYLLENLTGSSHNIVPRPKMIDASTSPMARRDTA